MDVMKLTDVEVFDMNIESLKVAARKRAEEIDAQVWECLNEKKI